jgi:hypothetical protein
MRQITSQLSTQPTTYDQSAEKRGGEAEDQIFLSARQSRKRASGGGYDFELLCSFKSELLTAVYFNRERCRLLVGEVGRLAGEARPHMWAKPRDQVGEVEGCGDEDLCGYDVCLSSV